MKVETFFQSKYSTLQSNINKWMFENPNIKICKIKQSFSTNDGTIYFLISIFYKVRSVKQDMGPG